MITHVGAMEAARLTGAKSPKAVSDLFWMGDLDLEKCPVVSGRRLIPIDYLPEIRQALKRRGWLKPETTATPVAAVQ